ncbi:MAG: carboxypeptidase-like regulatory domain-containing protein [Candidatus Marinimicrobia bacterium]|nr:carboxypeptidase-like regulatory domain-containing protein [Candidatus Neomarinimicrobiota bacterium]
MKAHIAFKVIFLTLALALSGISAQGQAGTISGFVRDSTNGESLSYVNVFLKETSLGAVTNRDGYYVIARVPRGQARSLTW